MFDGSSTAAKKIKEKFRSDISGHIVRHLKPYYSDGCEIGRIRSTEDFRFLARKVCIIIYRKTKIHYYEDFDN